MSNEKKRRRQPNINIQYQKFIQEYYYMGHTEKVPKLELDSLELLGPVVLEAKIIMQSLWALKLSWDEPIPEELESQWNSYTKQLSQLETILLIGIY